MRSWIGGYAAAIEISKPVLDLFLNQYINDLLKEEHIGYSRKFGKRGKVSSTLESITFSDFDNLLNHKGVVTDFIAEATIKVELKKFSFTTLLTAEIKHAEVLVEKKPSGGLMPLAICFPDGFEVDINFSEIEGWRGWILSKLIGPLIGLGLWFGTRIFKKIRFPLWDFGGFFEGLGFHQKKGSPVLIAQEMNLPHSLVTGFSFEGMGCTGNPDELFSLVPKGNNLGVIINEELVSTGMEFAYFKGWFPKRLLLGDWFVKVIKSKIGYDANLINSIGQIEIKRPKCWCRVGFRIKFKVGVKLDLNEIEEENPCMELQYNANINKELITPSLQKIWGVLVFQSVYMSMATSFSLVGMVNMRDFMPIHITTKQIGRYLSFEAQSNLTQKPFPLKIGFPFELWGKSRIDIGAFTKFVRDEKRLRASFNQNSFIIQEKEFGLALKLEEV